MWDKEKVKEWRKNNPEKYKEQCQKSYQKRKNIPKYKEYIRKSSKKWYQNNKEKCRRKHQKRQKTPKYKEYCRIKHQERKNTPKFRYYLYIKSAKERKLKFDLSFEEFMTFWQKPCYYCGDKIETIGLDRVDNKKGYSLDNIVSCCWECNIIKRDFSEKKFINKCKKIASRF